MKIRHLSAVAVVAAAAFIVSTPGVANAAQMHNPIEGYTYTDTSWRLYATLRHKTDPGLISFTPNNLACGGVGLRLYDDYKGYFNINGTSGVLWTDHSTKTLATAANTAPLLTFQVSARRLCTTNVDTFFSGDLFY